MTTDNSFQAMCTAELLRCLAVGGLAGARKWKNACALLVRDAENSGHPNPRVIVADCDLVAANLKGWCFDHCYLTRVNLTDATLQDASFDRAILRSCRLVRADLRGARFMRASIDGASLGWSVRIDKQTTLAFTGGGDALSGFDPLFRRRAEEDQRIFDMRQGGYSLTRAWYDIIDYGRSIWRIGLLLLGSSFLYSLLYYYVYLHVRGVYLVGKFGFYDFWLMSAQRLINAPAIIDSKMAWMQFAFLSEAVLGYGALALLAAVLLRKLTIIE